MTSDTTAANPELRYSLLNEPLIRYRRISDGRPVQTSLPGLFVAMAGDEVRDFPALRPHQRHPWHAFLTQLAAIALHRAQRMELYSSAQEWHTALLALTPDDPDGAAWCLVAPFHRPAILQAPVLGSSIDEWIDEIGTPDRLDMLITARNHDLKQARMATATPEDWLLALLSLQTQEGSNSGSYKGISRMNSGAGSRPGVGIASNLGYSRRWRRDVNLLLQERESIAASCSFYPTDGIALTWLVPWDGQGQISFHTLDPLYIEICRRVRLCSNGHDLLARTIKTPVARIVESTERKGRTGDPWTPIDVSEGKILTISRKGFDYQLVTELLLASNLKPAAAQKTSGWSEDERLQLVAQSIARGNSKTSGYHERRVPLTPKIRKLLNDGQRDQLAQIANPRIQAIGGIRKLLWSALSILFSGGVLNGEAKDSVKGQANSFSRPFEQAEDARFFSDLTEEIEATDQAAQRLRWQLGLVHRAEASLRAAFDSGPRNAMQRYRAQAAALSRFHGALRSSKSPLPDLAQYYHQQASVATASSTDPSSPEVRHATP